MAQRHETSDPSQTEALAAKLAAKLAAGDVVLVEGELGAGKTTFVRGACRALGVDEHDIARRELCGELGSERLGLRGIACLVAL